MPYPVRSLFPLVLTTIAVAALTACGGGGDDGPPVVVVEEKRAQDERNSFVVAPFENYPDYEAGANGGASFKALAGTDTDRWTGVLGGAGYRVEVPRNWNGKLVMYAHGYRGTGNSLTVSNPDALRKYLVDNGYAWAASSYSKNYYDVRAGVEDTNALANAFAEIARAKGRTLTTPSRIYITGHSMGGHITAAAIESEALATANNKVRYSGAVPMCGVTGDMALFDTFTAMQVAAQTVAGFPDHPLPRWSEIQAQVNSKLWVTAPGAGAPNPTPVEGERYVAIVKNLTGGERPLFRLALQGGGSFASAYGTFGGDGTVTGILNKWGTDTTGITYKIDGDAVNSAAVNAAAQKISEAPDANRLRTDGLRWVPQINGNFKIPVVAIHTLGDLFVPFNMIQTYRQRVEAAGNGSRLVTRAIRGISHCDFTVSEQVEAFDAMIKWEAGGAKPGGDDVLTAATVAAPAYGCTYTRTPVPGTDSGTVLFLRNSIATNGGSCPAP